MEPIVTPLQMGAIDAAAPTPTSELIERAGAAVAAAAIRELGGRYGRRVVVIAGPGNNGADGRAAARRLTRAGMRVELIAPGDVPARPERADLIVDAAFGTGFRGTYEAPDVGSTPVLAVDIPSGVDGLTGLASGRPLAAVRTVTFAAHKPGLLLGDGPGLVGTVEVADIGLDVGDPGSWLVVDADVRAHWPVRPRESHKWHAATWVVAGSPGMSGAADLATRGALRSGASYVRLSTPGTVNPGGVHPEVVAIGLPLVGWDRAVLDGSDRVASLVVGPGLGREDATREAVVALARRAGRPLVLDGDALWALASHDEPLPGDRPTVLTPHDGEYTQLTGHTPGADRFEAARRLAAARNAVVLLKGPTTIIAEPSGRTAAVISGSPRLASAGTGDVLSGIIGALLARGLDPFRAAALGAHVHGRAAAQWLHHDGLLAGDLADLVPAAVDAILEP